MDAVDHDAASLPDDAASATDTNGSVERDAASPSESDAARDDAGSDAGSATASCGVDVWHCLGTSDPLDSCRENSGGPASSAERLARSNCGDRALPGPCPPPGPEGGACLWMTGMVCFYDVTYALTDVQRRTARSGCLGTWTDG